MRFGKNLDVLSDFWRHRVEGSKKPEKQIDEKMAVVPFTGTTGTTGDYRDYRGTTRDYRGLAGLPGLPRVLVLQGSGGGGDGRDDIYEEMLDPGCLRRDVGSLRQLL